MLGAVENIKINKYKEEIEEKEEDEENMQCRHEMYIKIMLISVT